ncbi:MAG: hypothetical protein DRN55_04580, partial [Thermoplasmata archaeon]
HPTKTMKTAPSWLLGEGEAGEGAGRVGVREVHSSNLCSVRASIAVVTTGNADKAEREKLDQGKQGIFHLRIVPVFTVVTIGITFALVRSFLGSGIAFISGGIAAIKGIPNPGIIFLGVLYPPFWHLSAIFSIRISNYYQQKRRKIDEVNTWERFTGLL